MKTQKWYEIIFLEDYQLPSGFWDMTEQEKLNFLQQWDYGEYWNYFDQSPAGTTDKIYKSENYEMNVNSGVGYAGLSIVLEEEV